MKKLLIALACVLGILTVEAAQQQVWMQCFWGADVSIDFATAKNINDEVVPLSANVNLGSSAEFIAFPDGAQTVDHWRMSAGAPVYAGGEKISGSDGKTNLIWTATNQTATYLGVKFRWVNYNLAYDLAGGSGTASGTNGIPYTNAITLASAPTRTGWRFLGWRDAAGSVLAAGTSVTGVTFKELDSVHEDGKTVTLTAQWQEESYSVTSSGENCTVTVSKTSGVKYTDEVQISWNPNTLAGHTRTLESAQVLSGTTVLKTFTSGTSGTFNMSEAGKGYFGSVTVRVVYKDVIDQHRITVSSAGNGSVAKSPDQSAYDYGSSVTISATPYDGYAFAKWNDDVTDNPRAVTVGTADVTYTATFTSRVYTLTFDANGGTFADGSSTLTRNVAFQSAIGLLPDPPPTYPRMSPKGWFTEKSGGTSVDRDTKYSWTYDRPIYMQWQESHLYKIRLTATPAEAGTVAGGGDFAEGETTTLVATPNEGYSFASWSDGGAQTHDVTVGAADMTYEATFTANVYKVDFRLEDVDGNQYGGTSPEAQVRTYGTAFGELPRPTLDDEAFLFDHWTDKDGNAITAETIVSGGDPTKQEISLYVAVSRRPFYTIAYRGEGGTGTMADQKIYRGEETALTSNAFVRTGYAYQGWAETNDLTKVKYHDGTNVLDIAAAGATNELHAVWQPIRYRVVFDANGGKGEMPNQEFVYGKEQPLYDCTFTRGEFWKFVGWTNEVANVGYTNRETVVNLTADCDGRVILKAVWETTLSDLSLAMGCDNLMWTCEDAGWEAGTVERDGQSISCALTQTQDALMRSSEVTTNGILSFAWMTKAAGEGTKLAVMLWKADGNPLPELEFEGSANEWHKVNIEIDLVDLGTASVYFGIFQVVGDFSYITDMTWTPPQPVPTAVEGLVYTGEALTGVPAGANYAIVGNVATNAGDYVATATVTNGWWEGGATGATNIAWTIAKAAAPDVSGVSFADATFEYDGESHSISVTGTVPSGVEVVYTGDATNRTEVGTNTVTASFRVLDEVNYEAITNMLTAKLAITAKVDPPDPPKPVATNVVPTAVSGLVYDGTEKTGVAAGENYAIAGNVATNAGTYTAVATVTNGVWEGGATGATNVAWTIAKAPAPDVSGVSFADATYEYDGESHSIAVSGTVPSGVEVVYTGDATNRTEVGTNTVTASFRVVDPNNYEAVTNTLTAKLIIWKKDDPPPPPPPPQPVVTNAVPTAVAGLVYDGTEKTGVAAGANYAIAGNVATNAGTYTAVATVTNGVWEGGSAGATNIAWTIAKAAAPDVSGVTFSDATFEYDGESHSISVTGTVPSGVEVVYTGDATNRTEVGTNTVTASFRVLDEVNYEAITTTLTAKLAITAKEDPPVPPDPTVAYENIYFKATLAELGADAVPTNRKVTVKAEGLPKGLKLVTTALKDAKGKATGLYAYTVEGVPTETMDGIGRIAYVRVTDNKVQTLYSLGLAVRPAAEYENKSFPDGEVKSAYVNFSVTKLWPDAAIHPKNWSFSGWPSGIKYAAKDLKDARAYEVYGTPTKAGRFTVKAVEKIEGTSYKSTHVATFTVWSEGSAAGVEWTDRAYVVLPKDRTAGDDVASASGLPAGIKFTAKDIAAAKARHFYGTPTKAGTYAVTLTHGDKSKTQFLWTILPAEAPTFELKLSETEVDPETDKATIRLGVDYNWMVSNTPGSKVTASGLPTGLKLASGAVVGVPTKAGEYLATFKTTWNGVTVLQTAAFTVLGLPDWAQGTFDGGADETFPAGGQVNLTVSKSGKLSGKWMSEGTNWTLSAASYGRYDDATASYVAQVVGKAGTGKTALIVTNELSVAADAVGGLASSRLFLAYQDNWKQEPWKSLGKKVAKAPTFEFRPYADAGDEHTNDTISLKFAATGKVTVKASYFKSVSSAGKISWTTASGSAVLCPQGQPDGEAFPASVFVYLPPKKGTPTEDVAYAICVRLLWDGEKFVEWADPE